MAGIYVPGMDMPIGNEVIYIFSDGTTQKAVLAMLDTLETGKAIPVLDHGRLIDADELAKTFREDAADDWNKHATPFNWSDAFTDVADMVDDAPTIIPADKEAPD